MFVNSHYMSDKPKHWGFTSKIEFLRRLFFKTQQTNYLKNKIFCWFSRDFDYTLYAIRNES